MSKLFENELKIAKEEEEFFPSDGEDAGKFMQTWNSRKRSMLPKGNPAHTSKINILWNMYEHKNLCLF